MTNEAYFYFASRLVREVASLGGNVDGLVPKVVAQQLRKKFPGK
jgi:pantetheine-phosphate adenylyltransferase